MCNVCGKDLQYSLPRLFFIFPISVVHSPLFLHSLLLPQPLGWSFFVPVSLLNCCSSSLLPGDHLDPWRGQTLPRDSPETEAMHSSSITFPPPSTPPSPLYSFIHVPVSFHSCSVSPPPSPYHTHLSQGKHLSGPPYAQHIHCIFTVYLQQRLRLPAQYNISFQHLYHNI